MLINIQVFPYHISIFSLLLGIVFEHCSAKVIDFEYYPRFNNERPKRDTLDEFMTKNGVQNIQTGTPSALSATELNSEVHYLYRVQKSQRSRNVADADEQIKRRVQRRSISNAVIETARCEHIELLDCEDYENDEMTCMVTATGMPCCICTGKLKSLKLMRKKKWSIW